LAKQHFQIVGLRSAPPRQNVPYPHHHIQLAQFDVVLAEYLPNHSFYTISVCGAGQQFFAHNYSEPGVFLPIAHKINLEVPIRNISGANNMVEAVFTQQSVRSGKLGRYAKPRVWHGPWRGVH